MYYICVEVKLAKIVVLNSIIKECKNSFTFKNSVLA